MSGTFIGPWRPGILNATTVGQLPHSVRIPAYDRDEVSIGVVHLGPGAFHRAHQAVYFDDLLHLSPDWGVCAVSLRSRDLRDRLAEQDNLYVVAIMDKTVSYRVVGAIKSVLVAHEDPEAVVRALSAQKTRIVTLTVTEKGYCLDGSGRLDLAHPGIRRDLERPNSPETAVGYLVAGLRRRFEAGGAPLTIVSCDNLPDNGHRLRAAVLSFARHLDAPFAAWIDQTCRFPRSMVDCITPATTGDFRRVVESQIGLEDAWPIRREPFSQWVIEADFAEGFPPLDKVGVTFSPDIESFERAKIRLLNGAHSALAYLGLLAGVSTVSDAVSIPELERYVRALMCNEVGPSLSPREGPDLRDYVDSILQRFSNGRIEYSLAQIAWDGSQKIAARLLPTLADNLAAGRPIHRLALAVAAWFVFLRTGIHRPDDHVDPLKDTLLAIASGMTGRAHVDVSAMLGLKEVFPAVLVGNQRFCKEVEESYKLLRDGGREAVLSTLDKVCGRVKT